MKQRDQFLHRNALNRLRGCALCLGAGTAGVWVRHVRNRYGKYSAGTTGMVDTAWIWHVWHRYGGYGARTVQERRIWCGNGGYGGGMVGRVQVQYRYSRYGVYSADMAGMVQRIWHRYMVVMAQIWQVRCRYGGYTQCSFSASGHLH